MPDFNRFALLAIQIEKVDQDALQIAKKENDIVDNIVSMGDIVHVTLGHKGAHFNEQVTLTIPAPPVPTYCKKGKLQILTYLDDSTCTCTPCTSAFKSYKGYISLQSWHFSG